MSTMRHHYFVVRQVLSQSVADGRIMVNPTDHVKLPTEVAVADVVRRVRAAGIPVEAIENDHLVRDPAGNVMRIGL